MHLDTVWSRESNGRASRPLVCPNYSSLICYKMVPGCSLEHSIEYSMRISAWDASWLADRIDIAAPTFCDKLAALLYFGSSKNLEQRPSWVVRHSIILMRIAYRWCSCRTYLWICMATEAKVIVSSIQQLLKLVFLTWNIIPFTSPSNISSASYTRWKCSPLIFTTGIAWSRPE